MSIVTVIMPVYNGERYIEESIKSVFEQTYDDIELLVINDGSNDNSSEVLNYLLENKKSSVNMRIIEQDNQGICKTRNKALDIATGDFIMFMDQDDFMRPDCVERLYKEIETQNADLVIGGFDLIDDKHNILEKWTLNPDLPWSKFRITAPWGRIFRKSVIDKYNIRFMITKISEDFYFNMLYMSYCDKIVVTDYRGYCWLYNEKSESHANMSRLEDDRNPIIMLEKLHNDMNHRNKFEKNCLEYMMVKHLIWYMFFVCKNAEYSELVKFYYEAFNWLKRRYPDYFKDLVFKIGKPRGENIKTRLIVKASLVASKLGVLKILLRIYSML